MPRRTKERLPGSGFSKSVRNTHSARDKLARETFSLKGITKKHELFGKAKQQVLSARAKQEIRDACEAVLLSVEGLLEQCAALDNQREITDRLAHALWRKTKQAAQTAVFVPARESPCW